MKLLIATDHRYLWHTSGIFDTYCFDRGFFDDYRRVFDLVEVVCRMAKVGLLPSGARRSDGDGVWFIGAPDIHGLAWLLGSRCIWGSVLKSSVERADAVVVRVPSQLGWLAAEQARQAGKPYMVEVIGDPQQAIIGINDKLHYRLVALLEARRLKHLTRYATVSNYVSKHHLQRDYSVSNKNPCGNVSDIRLPSSEVTVARSFPQSLAKIKIVLVASLVSVKRHIDLMSACRCALNQGVDTELRFAGDGPCRKELEMLSAELGLKDRVIFYGHISDREVLMNLLDASDLFVMTSASEGLPRALLEAMARGLPVAGTRVGGIAELVRETELFPVGDVQTLAGLIVELVQNPRRLNEMSQYSIETAKQYTCDVLSPRRVHLYTILREKVTEQC